MRSHPPEIAFKKYGQLLANASRSALPLAARGTLNQLAFETRTRIRDKEMPRQFTIRNRLERNAIIADRSKNTFDIDKMTSAVGQLAVVKFKRGPKDMKDLYEQEFGKTLGPRRGSKLVRTPTKASRISKNHNRPVSRINRPSKGTNWPSLNEIERNVGILRHRGGRGRAQSRTRSMPLASRVRRAHALMIGAKDHVKNVLYQLPSTSKRGNVNVFRIINGKPVLMHSMSPKHKKLKKRPTVKPAYTKIVSTRADQIWEENVIRRAEKEARKILGV